MYWYIVIFSQKTAIDNLNFVMFFISDGLANTKTKLKEKIAESKKK